MATKASSRSRQRPAVAEDPRLTERRRSIARSKLRRRLWIAAAVLAVIGLVAGGWVVVHRSWFSAKTVTVVGTLHETPTQVISAAGLAAHPPLISIDTASAARGIEALPWVKTARVALRWPSSVSITVTERTPAAAVAPVAPGTRWFLVDASGRVLSTWATQPFGQVVVTAPVPKAIGVGGSLGPAAQPAVRVAATLPPAFRGQVAMVEGRADGTVTLHLTSPVTVMLGTATDLTAKYQDVASVIAGATLNPGDVVDVSVPQASTITGP